MTSLVNDMGSISPTFYEELMQIPKVHKDTDDMTIFLGSTSVKTARKHVGEIDPRRRITFVS